MMFYQPLRHIFFLIGISALVACVQVRIAYCQYMVIPGEYVVTVDPEYRLPRSFQATEPVNEYVKVVRTYRSIRNASAHHEIQAIPYTVENDECKILLRTPGVEACSPNYVITLEADSASQTYHPLERVKRRSRISSSEGDRPTVLVAVTDTGIDYNHPDLRDSIWTNPNEIPGNGIDDDRNGYIDDIHGVNTFAGTGDPLDDNGHGTHIAGIIKKNASDDIVVKLIGMKFLNGKGMGSLAGALKALHYLARLRKAGTEVRISNNSWGGAPFSESLYEAVSTLESLGIVFVAAAGNLGRDNDEKAEYPANLELGNVISVAAVDAKQSLASFSNFGAKTVDVAAAGVKIVSTFTGGGYREMSGTSMAAPLVTAYVAKIYGSDKSKTTVEIVEELFSAAKVSSTLVGVVRTAGVVTSSPIENENVSLKQDDIPLIRKIKIIPLNKRNKRTKNIKKSRKLLIRARGKNSGKVRFTVKVNKYRCEDTMEVFLRNGKGSLQIPISREVSLALRSFEIENESLNVSSVIRMSAKSRKNRRRTRQHETNLCKKLLTQK